MYVSTLLFASCTRNLENTNFIGPTAVVQSTSTGLSTTTADFATSLLPVYYTANFNQPVYWQLKIRGLKSGGVKVFSGYGNSVNISNTTWYGNSDSLYFFQAGEKCEVSFSVSGVKDPKIDTLYMNSSRAFPSDRFAIINSFNDFPGAYGLYDGDIIDNTDTLNPIKSQLTTYNSDSLKVIEGAGVGVLNGDLKKATGKFLFGGFYMPISLSAFPNGGANPDSIFINIIAKSDPAPYGNKLTLQISESEPLKDPSIPNSTGDVWAYDTPVLTTDWKVYSIRYSNLSVGYQCNGNIKREPEKMAQANINVIASTAGGKARCYVDFYVVTYGKPFQP